MYAKAKATLLVSLLVATAAVVVAIVGYVMASPTFGWTGAAGIHAGSSFESVRLILLSKSWLIRRCGTFAQCHGCSQHVNGSINMMCLASQDDR